MSYMVDSDVLIDAVSSRPDQALQLLRDLNINGLSISVISLGEVYEGAVSNPDPGGSQILAEFRAFLRPFQVLNLSDPIMERFARIRADLRRRGQMIPDCDILIGATAVEHQLTLVTGNLRHFQRIPGIDLYDLT